MNLDRYLEVRKAVLDYAKEVEDKKRMSYTAGAEDVLFNFKSDAEFVGTNPLQNAFTHLLKQFRGISSFVKHPDVEPSEPLISRAADLVNYACLMVAVAADEGRETGLKKERATLKDNPIWSNDPQEPYFSFISLTKEDEAKAKIMNDLYTYTFGLSSD